MQKILITGGAGYIGSHAVKLFLEKGYDVSVLDNFFTSNKDALTALQDLGSLQVFEADLRDSEATNKVFSENKFDAVLHFGALCSVGDSMKTPELYFENNVCGSLNLLKAMHTGGGNSQNKVEKLIFSSTCATYGESQYLPIDENHPQNPTNPYGESKLLVEKMVKWFAKIYDLKFVIFRYFNVCGASTDGLVGDAKNPSPHLVQNVVRGALNIEPFNLTCSTEFDTPDGSPIRDYVDVRDLVDAHFKAYEYLANGGQSDYINLGTGKGFSVLEIVKQVEDILGVEMPRNSAEIRPGEYAAVYADYTKAKQKLNWEPTKTLKDSVESLVKWYKSHPKGY